MPFQIPFTGLIVYSKHEIDGMFGAASSLAAKAGGVPLTKLVPSWTSSGGRYYYDLAHGLGSPPTVSLISTASNEFHNFDEIQITNILTTVRIWLNWDPGANIMLLRYF